MKSSIFKRSIVINGHKTSVSLEDAFWKGLKDIAQADGLRLSSEVAAIDEGRDHDNLSSAIRLFVLNRVRANYLKRAETVRSEPRPATAGAPP
jgi:predicted DNA-binding ribbon-helix-helix protein